MLDSSEARVLFREVTPTHCRIEGLDWQDPALEDVRRATSYIHPSAARTHRSDGWSGRVDLVRREKGDPEFPYLPTGLVGLAASALRNKGVGVSYLPKTRPPGTMEDIPVSGILPFQGQAVNDWAVRGIGIIQTPMRTGKTSYIGAGAIRLVLSKAPRTRVVFLCQDKNLLSQSAEALERQLGVPVGVYGGGIKRIEQVSVATIQTLARGWKADKTSTGRVRGHIPANQAVVDFVESIEFLVMDEVHHIAANQYQWLVGKMKSLKWRLGLGATPYSNEGLDLLITGLCGPVVYRATYQEMLDHNPPLLASPTFCFFWMPTQRELPLPPRTYSSGYQNTYAKHVVFNEARNGRIVEVCRARAALGESTAVLVDWLDHGAELARMMPEAIEVYGEHDIGYRRDAFDRVMRKEDLILISTVIREAVDLPTLNNTVFACGGKSVVKWPQSWRCMTSDGGKKKSCRIYSFVDAVAVLRKQALEQVELCRYSGFTIRHVDRPESWRKKMEEDKE